MAPATRPIERIGKQIKRIISYQGFIQSKEQLHDIIVAQTGSAISTIGCQTFFSEKSYTILNEGNLLFITQVATDENVSRRVAEPNYTSKYFVNATLRGT